MGTRRLVLVAALGVGAALVGMATSDAFRVSSVGGLEPPPTPGAAAGWDRTCLGWRHDVVMMDAAWEQCLGVPVGPQRCYAYGAPEGPGGQVGSVVRVPCPER